MRECGESPAGTGIFQAEGNCHTAFDRGEPLADRPATSDREPVDCVPWRDAWVAHRVLVPRRHCAIGARTPAARRTAARVGRKSGPARLGVFAGTHGHYGDRIWASA